MSHFGTSFLQDNKNTAAHFHIVQWQLWSVIIVNAYITVRLPVTCVCVCVSSGTGASCIYPLLGATMNGWYFLATEVDDICFDYATKNVEQNNLSDLVKGAFDLLNVKVTLSSDIRLLRWNSHTLSH